MANRLDQPLGCAALGGGLAVLASGVVHTIMGMRAMLKAGGAQAGAASGF